MPHTWWSLRTTVDTFRHLRGVALRPSSYLNTSLPMRFRRRAQSRREQVAEIEDLHDRSLSVIGRRQNTPIWVLAVARPVQPHKTPRTMENGGVEKVVKHSGLSSIQLVRGPSLLRKMIILAHRPGDLVRQAPRSNNQSPHGYRMLFLHQERGAESDRAALTTGS